MMVRARRPGLVLTCVLLLAACRGGTDEDVTPAPDVLQTPTPAVFVEPGTTAVPAAPESALVGIRQRGELRVGVLYNAPPFSVFTLQGTLEGFEVDLARAMAEEWGVDVTFEQVTRQTRFDFLVDGKVDMLAATVPHRRELHELVDFSQPYFDSGYQMLVPVDSGIEGLQDVGGQVVAIVEDNAFDVVGRQANTLNVAPTVNRYASTSDAVEALLDGSVAAVVGRREELMLATQASTQVDLTILDAFLQLEPYAFVVRRGDSNFRNLVNVTLQKLVEDGTYAALINDHLFGYAGGDPVVWPGEAPTASVMPVTLNLPANSRVQRVAQGQPLTVTGLGGGTTAADLNGQQLLDAFNSAIVNELARRWNVSINPVASSGPDGVLAALASGQADFALGVEANKGQVLSVDLSQPYLQVQYVLLHRDDTEVGGINQLDNFKVGVFDYLPGAQMIGDENSGVEFVDVTSPRHGLSLLQAGEIDVLMVDEYSAGLLVYDDPRIIAEEERYGSTTYVVAGPQFDSDFMALLEFTLQDMQADGTLGNLARQHFGPYALDDGAIAVLPLQIWPGSGSYLGLPVAP